MEAINLQVQDLIIAKNISPRKIRNLIILKKLVDRLAGKAYLPASKVLELESKFGVKPDIISWGDYFQTEIATDNWSKNDEDFEKIIQTITFDLIASILIFSRKEQEFFHQTQDKYDLSALKNEADWNNKDQENVHMGILLNYYTEMGLSLNALNEQDFSYFEQFARTKAVS